MVVTEGMVETEGMEVIVATRVTVVTEEAGGTAIVDMAERTRVMAVTVATAVNEMMIITNKEQEIQ